MLKRSLMFLFMFIVLTQCDLPQIDDIDPPVVLIIFPLQGAIISGDSLDILVQASDDDEIASVSFYIDTEFLGKVKKSPYTLKPNVANYRDNASHVLLAIVEDKSGNINSDSRNFTVSENKDINPPTGIITYPINGQTIFDTIRVTLDVNDDQGIDKAEYYVDGLLQFTNNRAPFDYIWDIAPWADNQTHTIFAKIYDLSANTTNTNILALTISGPDNIGDNDPPVINVLYPFNGLVLRGVININVDVQDASEIEKVEFYLDGALVSIDFSVPYSYSWNTAPFADGQEHSVYIKAFDSEGNIGTSNIIVVTVAP